MTKRGEPMRYFREVVLSYDGDECLTWPYAKDSGGYGQFRHNGLTKRVHRVICEKANGPAPTPDHEAAHSCGKGNEACCAKRHMVWKTHADNLVDCVDHGTAARGERCGTSKLTESDIHKIRALKGIKTPGEIGSMLGVHRATIGQIHRGERWGWLPQTDTVARIAAVNGGHAPTVSGGNTGDKIPSLIRNRRASIWASITSLPAREAGRSAAPNFHSQAKASEDNGGTSVIEGAPMPGEASRASVGAGTDAYSFAGVI